MKKLILAFAFLVAACFPLHAQNYVLAPIPKLTYLSNSGVILAGAKLCTLAGGSTTPKATYSNSTGTPNTNPVTLDSAGRANVWISSDDYKFILYNAGTGNTCNGSQVGSQIWSVDHIRDFGLLAYEGTSAAVTGTGATGRCAQWDSSTSIEATAAACGTITGTGTVTYLPKFSTSTELTNSRVLEDISGGPGLEVLKVQDRLLVNPNGTESDVETGVIVAINGITTANAQADAVALRLYTGAGGGGRAAIDSFHTGTGTTKPISFQIDGVEVAQITVAGELIIVGMACPAGMTAPVTVDDTGKLVTGTCS